MSKPICIVAGLGNATGTGASVARLWASRGFRVALVSRPRKDVDDLCESIVATGADARVFAVPEYGYDEIKESFERVKSTWKDGRIKTCILNFSQWSMKPFLDIDRALIETSSRINIVSSTAFCQCAVTAFMEGQAENPSAWSTTDGPGGTLIVTGATSAWRGSLNFGAFASGKGGLRNLTQSISREYGPKGVHVAFVVVDGTILTKRTNIMFGSNAKRGGAGWMQDTWQRLSPDSVANCYWYLQEQTPDAWSLEMDLRPAKENVAKI